METIGDVGQIIGGAVFFVNPALGGAIYVGSKVVAASGSALTLESAALDARINGNMGGLVSASASFAGQVTGWAAFSATRRAISVGKAFSIQPMSSTGK